MTDEERIDDVLVTLYAMRAYLSGESEYRRQQYGISGPSPLLASVEASIENLQELKKSLETNDN